MSDLETSDSSSNRILQSSLAGLIVIGIALLFLNGVSDVLLKFGSWSPFLLSLGLVSVASVVWFYLEYAPSTPGIKNNNIMFSGTKSRGWIGWVLGIAITAFYVVLYFYDDLQGFGLPAVLEGWTRMLDPLALSLHGGKADRWFLYGTFYTLAVLVMGTRMILKYRGNKYQIVRTLSVMFFQLGFSFLIPAFLKSMQQPEFYFTYFWPLKPDYLFPSEISRLSETGALGSFMVFWGVVMTFIATPLLTYFFGKRWYCSWVCGCGGLAETLGDPWRQNSSKSEGAWVIERWLIHSVLVAIVVVTGVIWANEVYSHALLGEWSSAARKWYGFYIGAIFSGVIGVGFYPVLGSRVWCRFGCPMAAILGLIQRAFSRFRITVNGDQCISCGNCSTYCEMGIDVRGYAQRGENIVRSSCVGCGVCAAVCPRGVLKLENGIHSDRFEGSDKPLSVIVNSIGSRQIY